MFVLFEMVSNNNINHSFYNQIDLLYNNIGFKKTFDSIIWIDIWVEKWSNN
jgi:hypothetical protein